jgi:N-acetylmuramoyl-L-alanine amidase
VSSFRNMDRRPKSAYSSPQPLVGRRAFLAAGAGLLAGLWASGRYPRSLIEGTARAVAAGAPVYVARDELLPGERRLAGRDRTLEPRAAPRFNLLGLHWQGSGEVWFRVRARDEGWAGWERAITHELPDPGSDENRRRAWTLGTPVWTEESTAVQFRLAGAVERLRAHFVWSPPRPTRGLALAGAPWIITRESWGADEAIVRGRTDYAGRVAFAVVHHTAGRSPSSPEESAAIVRAIQAYHVKGNGWDDIGYNALVDDFGQVFEGRRGGLDRNVVGAHALGFNKGSVGVALLGAYGRESPTDAARRALVDFLAWRLDVAHVDPLSLVGYPSDGTLRNLRAVSGHRDVNATACPGALLYEELDAVAGTAARTGLPKLYEPTAEGPVAGVVRFGARLSEPRNWSVTVTGPDGAAVARGRGSGGIVAWAWEAGSASPGRYSYAIEAGGGVLPATGSLEIGGPGSAAPVGPPPARPGSIPRRIPRWAWELKTWQTSPKATRGPRPAAPRRRLPHWYWEWRRWLAAVERWRRARRRA